LKTVTDNQRNGELGETLVKAAVLKLGHVFEGRGRLETGIDGTIEFRDPATGRMLGKTVAVQVKTTANGAYSREDKTGFEYLLRTADLEYWRNTNRPRPNSRVTSRQIAQSIGSRASMSRSKRP
jgi:hypothetical protein